MTTWTKISPATGRTSEKGRARRTIPAVYRSKAAARLVLPAGTTEAPRADIFSDGNGKLGFMFSDSGAFKVCKGRGTTSFVGIPKAYADRLPIGTTDAVLANDGPVTVLDLSQFEGAAAH